MAKVSAIDKYLKEQQKKEEQQRKKQVEGQTKAVQSTNKNTNMESGVSDSIKNLLKKQTQTSNNKSTSFLSGTPKREEVKPVQIKKNVPERSFLTGEQEDSKVVNQSQKKKLTDYSSIGEYRKAEQENYKKNKEIALQDEALQSILAMDQTKERDMAKDKYMRDTNLSWRLNELRNKNNKSIEEENELAQLEHKLLELTNLRRANDTLVDDAILDAAGVVSNTYNSAAYNTDLLLQSIFNPNEKLVETRNADLINQINSGRANTTQALNAEYGDWAGFLYQTGLSISDNLALRVLDAFVPGAALVAMGSNAAAQKALEVGKKEDATAFEQLGRGLISGGIEYATERLSFLELDKLLGPSNARSVVKGMIGQAIDEGKEEGLSYALNLVADSAFGDDVQWSWQDFAQSVLGGALSGGLMGGPAQYIGNKRFDQMAKTIKTNATAQQQFKQRANIEDISLMTDEQFRDLLANTMEAVKEDVGEKKFNKMNIHEILDAIPAKMTEGERKMWQAGDVFNFDRALQLQSLDPITSMTQRNMLVDELKREGKEYGLNEKSIDIITGIVNNTGVNVVFTTDMKGQKYADGYYENGTIYINPNGVKPYMQTLKHELTHHIQNNPEFAEIKNFLINEYQSTDKGMYRYGKDKVGFFSFNDLVAKTWMRYFKAGKVLPMEDAEFEALADLVSTSSLFADEKGINQLADIHTDVETKSKIAEFFDKMSKRYKEVKQYEKELERIRDLYSNTAKNSNEQNNNNNNDISYSIGNFDFNGKEVKAAIVDEKLTERMGRNADLKDVTENLLSSKIGLPNLIESASKIVYFGKELPHEYVASEYSSKRLNSKEFKVKMNMSPYLEEALSTAQNFRFDSVDRTVNGKLKHGKLAKNGWYKADINLLMPVNHSNQNLGIKEYRYYTGYLLINCNDNNSFEVYDLINIKNRGPVRVDDVYDKTPLRNIDQTYIPNPPIGFGKSLTQEKQKSSKKKYYSISNDSKDKILSEQQKEYFKDSKVLDDKGNLKVMYRGGNEDINVFDRKKSRASNLYGRGFYFTDSEAHAKQYGDAKEYYLNITNPLSKDNNITREQIVNLLQAIEDDGEDMDLSNYGYGATVDSIADSLMGKDDFAKLQDISSTAVGDLVKTVELFNELNGTSYDGFILPTETVVFDSAQIKKTDNEDPTSNPDVRYSIAASNDELSKIQQNYLNNLDDIGAKGFVKYLQAVDDMDVSKDEKLKRIELVEDRIGISKIKNNIYNNYKNVYLNDEYSTFKEFSENRERKRQEEMEKRYSQKQQEFEQRQEEHKRRLQLAKEKTLSAEQHKENAIIEFGTTTNFKKAAYILTDGQMLNFGGNSYSRGADHRAIASAFNSEELYDQNHSEGPIALTKFLNEGNIRIIPESNGLDMSNLPTEEQFKQISNFIIEVYGQPFIVDFSDKDGNVIASKEYKRANRNILEDIKDFYNSKDIKYSISSNYTNDIKDLLKKYGSLQMRNAQEVEDILSQFASDVAKTGNYDETMINSLMSVIRKSVMAENDSNDGVFDIYSDIMNNYKNTKVLVPERLREYVKSNGLVNKLKGLFTLTYDESNYDYQLDSLYKEISEAYDGYLDAEAQEEDQLLNLANIKDYKLDNRKMAPIGETNAFVDSQDAIYNDVKSYLDKLAKRINQLPETVKAKVSDVYTLRNAEKFVEKNTRLQNFNKYYFNNINEKAVGSLGVYTKRSENTQKLFQDAIQEIAQGGDITNRTRDLIIKDLVSNLDKTNEIKLDPVTEEQMNYFKADTDATFTAIVKEELDNLIRDVSFAMNYTEGTLFDDKTIKAAQIEYEKQLREKYRGEKVKMASDIIGKTPEQKMKQLGAFDAFQTKKQLEDVNKEFDAEIAAGADVGQLTGVDAALINKLREEGVDKVSFNKTLAQNFDKMAGKSVELRELLRAAIERPLNNAKKRMFNDQKFMLERVSNIVKKYNIKPGSKESAAVQWYGEGSKDTNDGDLQPYTLKDLQQEFPDRWEDIVACEKECRQIYDEYFEKVNRARALIYPNPLEQGYVDLANAQYRVQKYESIIASSKNNNRYSDEFIRKQQMLLEQAKNDVQRISEAIDSGDYTLNKVLPKRKDYFHHFQEMADAKSGIMGVLQSGNDYKISNKLSGISADTKPKSKFTGFMQHRGHGDYQADAIGGLVKYIPAAEFASYVDPQIAHMRAIIKAMRDTSNVDDTDMAYTINYLTQFTNKLAGKTFVLDRIITDVFQNGRKRMQVIKAINSRVKGNAILGNMRSAISQFYNLPVGLSMISNPKSMIAGTKMYAQYLSGNQEARDLMNESAFLQERYFDNVLQELDLSEDGPIKQKAMWLTQFGDEVVTRNLWFGAYADAVNKNMNRTEAIEFADDLTRNAVAGRGIGEVPLMQQSEVVKLLAPFQVEVNNQWQYIKSLANNVVNGDRDEKLKAAWQMFVMFGVTWAMNELREKFLDGNRTGMDIVNAFTDAVSNIDAEENAIVNTTKGIGRVAGEVLSNVPYAAQILPSILSQEQSEGLFGDADPTRYGSTNIGIGALISPVADALRGENIDVQELVFDYATPFGGAQANRTLGYLQDVGVLPSLSVNLSDGISVNKNEVPGAFTQSGKLKYALDTEDVAENIRGLLFGSTGTQAARAYYDNDGKTLSESKTQAYVDARKAGASYKQMEGVMDEVTSFESLKDEKGNSISHSKGLQTAKYIDSLDMGDGAKESLYKTYALSDSQKEVYDKAIAAGGTYNQLKDAMFDIAMMESLKDSNGKTIANSKALQTAKYINNLNVSENVKQVLRDAYLNDTVKAMSAGEVNGRLNNAGTNTSKSSSRSSSAKVSSVSSRIKRLLGSNVSYSNDFYNQLKTIIKEFESKSKVS